jgi:hypothetical protein
MTQSNSANSSRQLNTSKNRLISLAGSQMKEEDKKDKPDPPPPKP